MNFWAKSDTGEVKAGEVPKQAIVLRREYEVPAVRPKRTLTRVVLILLFGVIAVAGVFTLWLLWRHHTAGLSELTGKAKRGDAASAFELGKAYDKGLRGAPKDAHQAVYWYTQAAEHGDARAQSNLGEMYRQGDGVSKNYGVAFTWFRRSAAQGNRIGERDLAGAYLDGLGVPQSFGDSFSWMRKAAEDGDPAAQAVLCDMYALGLPGFVPKDPTIGYAWCLVARAEGLPGIDEKLSKKIVKRLSPLQVAEAQALAGTWWASRQQRTPMPEHSKEFGKAPTEVVVKPGAPIAPRGPANSRRYRPAGENVSGCESGHWVKSKSDDGLLVELEDGSFWRIAEVDAVDTLLWLPTESVVVCDDKLINSDSGDTVEAARVK